MSQSTDSDGVNSDVSPPSSDTDADTDDSSTTLSDITIPVSSVDPDADLESRLTDNTLYRLGPSRYFDKDDTGEPIEDWHGTFERVATNVAQPEKQYDSDFTYWQNEFESAMREQRFMPNSPTIMNAGTEIQQLSACFVNSPRDDMDDIGDKQSDAMDIFYSGGGLGYSFSFLRPKGAVVRTTGGRSSGPISFMELFDTTCGVIKQGGRRRGAQMAILHAQHPDIGRFINAKYEEDRFNNFNISVGVSDEFIEAKNNDEAYTLYDPEVGLRPGQQREPFTAVPESVHLYSPEYEDHGTKANPDSGIDDKVVSENIWRDYDIPGIDKYRDRVDVEVGEPLTLPAGLIWQIICYNAWRNGEPGLFYIDETNREHSFDVKEHPEHYIYATNPCVTGDTLVATADGRGGVPIEDLTDETDVPVYTRREDEVGVELAQNIRMTREDADLVEIETDGEVSLECTEDHPVWTRNRGWVKAGNLKNGDSLHILYETEHNSGYNNVRWTDSTTRWNLEHRLVARDILDMDITDMTVHHKNNDKTDNRPSNLDLIDPSSHGSLHSRDISGDDNPIHQLKRDGNFEEYKQNNSFYQTEGENNPMSGERAKVVCNECGETFKNVTNTHLETQHGMTTTEYKEKHPDANLVSLKNNHKVTSVTDAGTADVYDLEVPQSHNFYAGDTEGEYVNIHNCGEQPLEEKEACNLGHVNLSLMVDDDRMLYDEWASEHISDYTQSESEIAKLYLDHALDHDEFDRTVRTGTRFLDNVVTMSEFPLEGISNSVKNKRKIGLGLMGFAQMLVQLGIPYGSDLSYAIAREIMRRIDKKSVTVSHELAQTRGNFNEWDESKYANPTAYPDWFEKHTHRDPSEYEDGFDIRNHNTTTIAPTGTTSMIGDTSGGCEPIYSVGYFKNVSEDVQGADALVEFDDFFLQTLQANDIDVDAVTAEVKELMNRDAFDGITSLDTVPDVLDDVFVTTQELTGEQHIRMQGAFQEYVDSGISKTLNMAHDVEPDEIGHAFDLALDLGIKGSTIYRDGSRDTQVNTTDASSTQESEDETEPDIDAVLSELDTETLKSELRHRMTDADDVSEFIKDLHAIQSEVSAVDVTESRDTTDSESDEQITVTGGEN